MKISAIISPVLYCFLAAFWSGCGSIDPSGAPAGPEIKDLPVALGSASGCSLSSDQPSKAGHGTLRLRASTVSSMYFSDLRTGRSLTLAQLIARTSSAFGSAAGAAAGVELGKIGDLKYGGEAAFVADGKGGLAIAYRGNSTGSTDFTAAQVQAFKQLLDQAQ